MYLNFMLLTSLNKKFMFFQIKNTSILEEYF